MIYVPPVDPADYIMQATDELQKCINKYFGEISLEEASKPEILDDKYSPDLVATLRGEYYKTLEKLWHSVPTSYHASFEAVVKFPSIDPNEDLQKAYAAATKRSFWERLGKTNYKDVMAYKQLLKANCESILYDMHSQFTKAVIDINGR